MAGDRDGWEHARGDLLESWRNLPSAVVSLKDPSFTIDIFKAGDTTVIADQCYERAGQFGVIYKFTVLDADRQIRSFFTIESPERDNFIAAQIGQSQVFSLDHFRVGIHETVSMLPHLPPYSEIRQRIVAYTGDPKPVSSSKDGSFQLSTENCAIETKKI